MPPPRKRSRKPGRRRKVAKRPPKRRVMRQAPPPVLLRPGDEETLKAALKRVPIRTLAKSFGVAGKTLRKWAKKGIPAPKESAKEFRELLELRRQVEVFQEMNRRAREVVKTKTPAKVARELGISIETVGRWIRSKNPERAREIIEGKAGRARVKKEQKARAKKGREEEATFAALVKASGEVAEIPIPKTTEGHRIGRHTKGYRWQKAVRQNLSAGLLTEIERWADTRPKKYSLFQLVARVSLLALSPKADLERKGKGGRVYPTVHVQLPHKKTGDFAIDAVVTSGAWSVREEAISDITDKLTDLTQGGMVLVFVHSIEMKNYRRRSEDERKSFESLQRSKGKWKKRGKR